MELPLGRIISLAGETVWRRSVAAPYIPKNPISALYEAAQVVWPKGYAWKHADKWGGAIRDALSEHASIILAPVPQKAGACISAAVSFDGAEPNPLHFDFSDYPAVEPEIVSTNAPYFKFQYVENYEHAPNVFPGGYLPNDPVIYPVLQHLRGKRHSKRHQFDIYGRFGKGFALEMRTRCIETLASAGRPMHGGFEFVRYTKFLREAAVSKICVDLPGNGPLCFRFIDFLALGCFIIAYPHCVKMPVPLIDGEHLVYMREDMSDLPDLVEYYLKNDSERERIAANARDYFDTVLARNSLGAYYLSAAYEWNSLLSPPLADEPERQNSPHIRISNA